jgi:hypothetical protein
MKNLRYTILTVVLLVATAVSASAQTKVATVDMKKLFNGYYKTKLAQSSLENRKADLKKEIKDMIRLFPRTSAINASRPARTRPVKSIIPAPPSNNFSARPKPSLPTKASA